MTLLAYSGMPPTGAQTPFIAFRSFSDDTPGPNWRTYYDHTPARVPNARAGAAYSGPLGAAAAGYRVTDGTGYTFEVQSTGALRVVDAPLVGRQVRQADGSVRMVQQKWGVGTVYAPGDPAYEVVVARLKARDPNFEAALGPASTGVGSADVQKAGFFAQILGQLGLDTPEGQAQVAQIIATEGPGVVDAVKGVFASRGKSLGELTERLAVIRAQLPSVNSTKKRARLQAEAAGIQAEIGRIQTLQTDPLLTAPVLPQPRTPFWLLPAGLGLAAVVAGGIIFFFAAQRRGR